MLVNRVGFIGFGKTGEPKHRWYSVVPAHSGISSFMHEIGAIKDPAM